MGNESAQKYAQTEFGYLTYLHINVVDIPLVFKDGSLVDFGKQGQSKTLTSSTGL